MWNEHVETGECQMKLNQREAKVDASGRSTHCQVPKCKTKITDINYFKCPKCAMDLCMPHRFDDEHNCKPVKQSEVYEKIKKNNKLFNWNIGKSKSVKKKDDGLSFGDKLVRFFVCCGTENKENKNKNKRRPPPNQINSSSSQKGNLPQFVEETLKCPLCSEVFPDSNMLLYHTNEFHKEKPVSPSHVQARV